VALDFDFEQNEGVPLWWMTSNMTSIRDLDPGSWGLSPRFTKDCGEADLETDSFSLGVTLG